MSVCASAVLRQHRSVCVDFFLGGVDAEGGGWLGSTIRALIYHAELRV